MRPLTIACLPIAQPSFLQDSLADKTFVGKGLAGPHASLQTSPAVLGAVTPSRPRVPTTWVKSRKVPSALVKAQHPGNRGNDSPTDLTMYPLPSPKTGMSLNVVRVDTTE